MLPNGCQEHIILRLFQEVNPIQLHLLYNIKMPTYYFNEIAIKKQAGPIKIRGRLLHLNKLPVIKLLTISFDLAVLMATPISITRENPFFA